jgi:DNA ligase-1
MQAFAALLDRLVLTPQRNAKLRLLVDYFRAVPDPDRGYALAALTGELDIPSVKPAMLRALVEARVDGVLFAYSYDYVGDLAETISLIWPAPSSVSSGRGPAPGAEPASPRLSEVVERLQAASRSEGPKLVEGWLDALDATGRWALIKLVVGGLRIGVSARLAKQALADLGSRAVNEIEEVWHGVAPPYTELFAWLEGRAPRPQSTVRAPFRPVMLSHAIADDELLLITPDTYAAEWKWDGIRVQAVNDRGTKRLYTRTGDDISHTFPDLVDGLDVEGAIDGELLIGAYGDAGFALGSFSDLQQRLNRKTISGKLMESHPAFLRAYDCLIDGEEDIRTLSFRERRGRLEALVARALAKRMDLSPLLAYRDGEELAALRGAPPDPVIEGLMLKRWDSVYEPGRPKGPWFKWKRDPHTIDAVLMYAQRGHGKRSSYYSDYTFGVWREGPAGDELVPVGKAYFGFTDEELAQIDRFVRNNTVSRFGPVREVVHEAAKGLVLEVAFEGLARSTRHKSGVAMRFPRIARLRWDKPPSEADRLETLEKLVRA